MNDVDLSGLIPATVLPMTDDGAVNECALRSYIRWLLSFDGLKALAANMDTGEGPHLSREERRQILEIYIEETRGRTPVLAGISARHTAEAEELARDAASAGVAGVVVFPIPAFAGDPPPAQLVYDYHRAIAAACGLPVVLFQLQPALAGALFTHEMLLRLIDIPNVIAIKEASFDAVRFAETRRILDAAPRRIQLLTGNDTFIYESFVLGATGALVGFGTVAVAEQIEMFALLADRRYDEAARINEAVIRPLADALFAPPVRNYRARLKEALRLQGVLPRATVRPPLLDLDDAEREAVRAAVDAVRIVTPAHA